MGTIGLTFLGILLFLTSVFMMLLILVQRGKGGGLTGALGGMGGQSAFGSKAGDVFTRITVITAIIWITLCMITIAAYNPPPRDSLNAQRNESGSIVSTDDDDGETAGGMTNGDSADSDTSSDEGTSDETSSDELDKEIEDLVEDDIDSPADPESDGETTETNSDEDADNSETSTDDSEDTGDEESSDDN